MWFVTEVSRVWFAFFEKDLLDTSRAANVSRAGLRSQSNVC